MRWLVAVTDTEMENTYMSLMESVGGLIRRCALCALLGAIGGTVSFDARADSSSEADPRAAFVSMVSKLEKLVGTAKKHVFSAEGEVKKLAKRAETASWRVAAARERFEQYQSEISSTKAPDKLDELKGKLANEVRLLKTDADKLTHMVDKSKELRAKSSHIAQQLSSLKDDVAIEADRFDQGDRTQKKALQLIAEAEWASNKLGEVNAALESALELPASETLSKTQVE
jgi:predicted  nucleic acid-binding Zn-ribbon protein